MLRNTLIFFSYMQYDCMKPEIESDVTTVQLHFSNVIVLLS